MIDEDLKTLINELETILKKDSRFKLNNDDQYRHRMKRIYQESKYNKKSIDFSGIVNLANLNNTVDIGDLSYINHINTLIIQAKTRLDNIINN